jgi:hypothetical protein
LALSRSSLRQEVTNWELTIMNAVAVLAALWLKRGFALLRSIGPYAAIEILLPGGTIIALLLWLSRQGAFRTSVGPDRQAVAIVCACR